MIDPLLWLTPLVVLPIVAAFGFVGCTRFSGEDLPPAPAPTPTPKPTPQTYPEMIAAAPNLVAYWRLSEGVTSDTVAKDSGPNKIDGQYLNPAGVTRSVLGALSLGPDPADLSAEFDSGKQGYVEIPYDPLLNPQIFFTLELWVRPPDAPMGQHVIAGAYELDATGKLVRGYVLEHLPGPPPKFRVRLGTQNAATPVNLPFDYGAGVDYDKWRHIVIVYDGSTSTLTAYLNCTDGNPVASIASKAGKPVALQANQAAPTRLAVGLDEKPHTTPVLSLYYKGRIDEVALYNGALDGATVKAHFLRGTTPPS